MRVTSATGPVGRASAAALRVRPAGGRVFAAQQYAGNPQLFPYLIRQSGTVARTGASGRVLVHRTRMIGPPLPQRPQNYVAMQVIRSSRAFRLPQYARVSSRRVFDPSLFLVPVRVNLSAASSLTATAVDTVIATASFSAASSLQVLGYGAFPEYSTSLDYRPSDTTLVLPGYDLAEQCECQLGNGANVPTGNSDFGFTDTTYTVTKAQILAGVATGAY